MRDVVKYEKIVDEKVLKCYYNICKYYNQDIKLIRIFLECNLMQFLMQRERKVIKNEVKI